MQLSLVLTHQCDLACAYCYTGAKDARRMSPAVGRRAIERALLAVPPGGTLELGLFGGEPLLAWDLGRELLRFAAAGAAERGVALELNLTTNGTHLDDATLDEALALGVRISVSMDGLPAVHDAWRPRRGGQPSSAAALAAIARLRARGQTVRVVSVVRPETAAQLAAGARFLVEQGVQAIVHSLDYDARWEPRHASPLQRAVAELRELYVECFPRLDLAWLETKALLLAAPGLGRPRCGLGEGEIAVAPSGRLYPCERLVGTDAPGPHAAGHVDGEGPLRLERSFCSTPAPQSMCDGCATRPYCTNDCACANSARTGEMARPDGLICTLEQACLREARTALLALFGNERPGGRRGKVGASRLSVRLAERRKRRLPLVEASRG